MERRWKRDRACVGLHNNNNFFVSCLHGVIPSSFDSTPHFGWRKKWKPNHQEHSTFFFMTGPRIILIKRGSAMEALSGKILIHPLILFNFWTFFFVERNYVTTDRAQQTKAINSIARRKFFAAFFAMKFDFIDTSCGNDVADGNHKTETIFVLFIAIWPLFTKLCFYITICIWIRFETEPFSESFHDN